MSMVLANVITYSGILKFIEFPSHLLVKLLHRIFILKNGKILKNSSQIQILHAAACCLKNIQNFMRTNF